MAEPVLAPHIKLFWTASNLQKEVIYDKKGYLHAGPNTLALPRGLYGVDEILIMGFDEKKHRKCSIFKDVIVPLGLPETVVTKVFDDAGAPIDVAEWRKFFE